MGSLRHYRVIEFHQVCAIARVVLLRDPTVDDAEWKAAVKDTCAKQGYDEPPGDMLPRAMAAVEQALLKEGRPRESRKTAQSPAAAVDTGPLTRAEAAVLAKQYDSAKVIKRMPNVRPLTLRETERQKALKIFAQGILEQVKRCEEVEQIAADAEAHADPDPSKVTV